MPRKFGENPRVVEARERKETKKLENRVRKEKAMEDAKWVENDPKILKKFDRKAEEERKHEEQLARRRENARLAEEEMNQLTGKSSLKEQPKKITQFEIMQEKERIAQVSRQSASAPKRAPALSSTTQQEEKTEASATATTSSDSSTAVDPNNTTSAIDISNDAAASPTEEPAAAAAASSPFFYSNFTTSLISLLSSGGASDHRDALEPVSSSASSLALAPSSQPLPKNVSIPARALERNLNRALGTGEEGALNAHSVDEALAALSVAQHGSAAALADAARDRRTVHKRARVAYRKFEQENLDRLRAENPSLKLSQVKQLLREEWDTSSENPINQLEVTARSLARFTMDDDDDSDEN